MITKSEFAIVLKCAEIYRDELLDSNVLFIYENRVTKKIEYIESTFLAANFKHLTGIIYPKQNLPVTDVNDKIGQAEHFFNLALLKRLNRENCKYKKDGTTSLKLQILVNIMNIKRNARMIGDYNQSRLHIMADKMCGSVAATLALTHDREYGLCPSSTIKDDIRNLVRQYHPVIAIYQKKLGQELYEIPSYSSKRFDKERIPSDLKKLIK